jgi:predicted phosphodiesterase
VKRALISDIHGNYEALAAVLDYINTLDIDEIICLGDIIGYGPDPIRCLDIVMDRCKLVILGNHDQAAIFDPEGFNPVATRAIYWTREQLEQDAGERADLRWDFLGELPRRHDEGEFLFVHGSPRDPTNEYVFPEHIYEKNRMESLMRRFDQYCFQGHTHIPGVFTEGGSFIQPEQRGYFYQLDGEKCMINVGSVGQPRDEDYRACFVVLDTELKTIRYHRVEYDAKTTRNKIYAIAALDNMLGDRLLTGR